MVYRAVDDYCTQSVYWGDGKIKSRSKRYDCRTLLSYVRLKVLKWYVEVLPHQGFIYSWRGTDGQIIKIRYEENVLTGAKYRIAADNITPAATGE
jgi:hypothetical protein